MLSSLNTSYQRWSALVFGNLARQAMWLAGPFVLQQAIRLFAAVSLAHLLAPKMIGVMVLINTLRTGAELLSDIGVGQSVVRSPHSLDRRFLDTAFSIQLVRGIVLCVAGVVAAWPVARLYGDAQIALIMCVASLGFLTTGLQSPDLFLMQRDLRIKQRAIFDISSTVLSSIVTIILAFIWRDQWALVWGMVIGSALSTCITYAFAPFVLPQITWERRYLVEIMNFGKWIFLSTAIYFAAMSVDKFYFSAVLPMALVGIYGVAKTFSDMLSALAQRLGEFLVFPKVVEIKLGGGTLGSGFKHKRRLALSFLACVMVVALAVSDQLILLLYDRRYDGAAFMLPVLLAGAWFSILAAFAEATLFGLSRPQAGALGSAIKFGIMMFGLPLLVPVGGIWAGLIILTGAEAGRWLALSAALVREQLSAIVGDLFLTLIVALGALALKATLGHVGLVPSLNAWWALGDHIHR